MIRGGLGPLRQPRQFREIAAQRLRLSGFGAIASRMSCSSSRLRLSTDKKVLKLIRSYLEAGVMADGVRQPSEEGTPQGSPLSPLLSNVCLDDLDRMLERRGHRFVRYADDITIYVRSRRAAERVMRGTCEFIEQRLKLRVNREKSAVGHATSRTLLGFGFLKRGGEIKVRIDPKARKRAKDRLRKITSRSWGISMERRIDSINRFSRGWTAYFALADTPSVFEGLDEWLRRRLREVRWKEWKRIRTKHRSLAATGIPDGKAWEWANSRLGYWRIARSWVLTRSLTNAYWREQGLRGFADPYRRFRDATRTAGCGPARPYPIWLISKRWDCQRQSGTNFAEPGVVLPSFERVQSLQLVIPGSGPGCPRLSFLALGAAFSLLMRDSAKVNLGLFSTLSFR